MHLIIVMMGGVDVNRDMSNGGRGGGQKRCE